MKFSRYQDQIFFCMFHKVCLIKQSIQYFYISPTFQIKNKVHIVETRKFRKLSFEKKKFSFFSGYISEIGIVSLLPDVSKILWKKILDHILKICARR